MLRRLFVDHPESLGESYAGHQKAAASFGGSMVLAGLACLVHAVIPGLFAKTGSRAVARLHAQMSARRRDLVDPAAD